MKQIALIAGIIILLMQVVSGQGYYSDTITGDDSSGELIVQRHVCEIDYECEVPGEYCYNYKCTSCPTPAPACQHYEARSGCTPYPNSDGSPCGNPGQFCSAGACVSCWPAGGNCTSDANCCIGLRCDASNSKCVSCDANSVQVTPSSYGGGKCEASCTASASCDELAVNAYTGLGKCKTNCQFCDGDLSQAGCDSCAGTALWNIGGDIAQTTCCNDDSGEAMRYKQCGIGLCIDDPNDKACCTSDTDCVFQGKCYTAIAYAMLNVSVENTPFCLTKNNQNSCTSGDVKAKCQWNGTQCIGAATKEAVLRSQPQTNFPAYADIDSDGRNEVCVSTSPGKWQATNGTIVGTVTNVTDPVPGAQVRIIATGKTATTASDGTFIIRDIKNGFYDVLASKPTYETQTKSGIEVLDDGTTVVDFLLIHSSGDCKDDCTKIGSNYCDQSCQGKGLCWFQSTQVMQACHGTFGLIELPGGQFVHCCKGAAYSPIKADISVPAKNMITTKKPVLYQGKLLNLVMVVFQR